MTNYPEKPEIVLTTQELRLYARLRKLMDVDTLEMFVTALEQVAAHGKGMVTVKIFRRVLRFVERTFTDDTRV